MWKTSRSLTVALCILSLVTGIVPASIAYIGKIIIDTIVSAMNGDSSAQSQVWMWIAIEMALVVVRAGLQRSISVVRELLRAKLGHQVNVLILEKATMLSLAEFEDSELYDKLTRARREASRRPLSLVMRFFGIGQDAISLASYAALLFVFSPLAMLIVIVAAIPAFVTETRFSGQAFRLFQWRTAEARQQMYLETVIAREDYAKEVSLFGLGKTLLSRYQDIFRTLYKEDRNLTIRRGGWGFVMEVFSSIAFYGAYAWIVYETMQGKLSLGEMTMYLMIFKQAQSSFASVLSAVSGMYDDNLYLSNLFAYLDTPVSENSGTITVGEVPGDGIRFDKVSFRYPGATSDALTNVSLHIPNGATVALVGHNGSGKTTLVKLLTRLYEPTAGQITIDGTEVRQWQPTALRQRIGVIFQDFARYQFTVGENIGVGDAASLDNPSVWDKAATQGLAKEFIDSFPDGYDTQLGRWFRDGRELSGGQWQKIALSRAFVRSEADILILDEPTAAMDALAEAQIFEHFHETTKDKIAIVISHRFSTVRHADTIFVFHNGVLAEVGSHEKLLAMDGRYANLFRTQAAGYL